MSDKIKLGELIEGESARDAIHIAITPAIASEKLFPGQAVGLTCERINGVPYVAAGMVPIGIVDPFLKAPVFPGIRFYVMLFPNTITSLRHEWTHPAFDDVSAKAVDDASKAFIEKFAVSIGRTYAKLMEDAKHLMLGGDPIHDDSESYKRAEYDWHEFWKHYANVTGDSTEPDWYCPYTCSC